MKRCHDNCEDVPGWARALMGACLIVGVVAFVLAEVAG